MISEIYLNIDTYFLSLSYKIKSSWKFLRERKRIIDTYVFIIHVTIFHHQDFNLHKKRMRLSA